MEGATGAKARLPNLLVAAVSAAMTAFLVYNVIAGEYTTLVKCRVHDLDLQVSHGLTPLQGAIHPKEQQRRMTKHLRKQQRNPKQNNQLWSRPWQWTLSHGSAT